MTTRFKLVYLEHSYDQKQIARLCGVSVPSVSRWLSGSIKLPVAYSIPLSNLFGVNPEDLLGEVDEDWFVELPTSNVAG